jgi:hypothetical protein
MEDMIDERLIECDSSSTDIPRTDNKLVYGDVYRTNFCKDEKCLYLGVLVKARNARHVIAYRKGGGIKVTTFTNYSWKNGHLVLDNMGFPALRKHEEDYLIGLLEEKLGNQAE